MTLNDYRNSRYEDMFLAVIKKEIDWENAHKVRLTIPDSPDEVTALDLLRRAVDETLKEEHLPLTEENKKQIEEDVKNTITPQLEEWYTVILLKYGDTYIDLSKMNQIEEGFTIDCLVPFKGYYDEGDYSFEEDEDGPYLNIDMEPFNRFVKEYEEGKFS